MCYNIIAKFQDCYLDENLENKEFFTITDFLYEVMGISLLDKEDMENNMETMNMSYEEWFDSEEELKMYMENDNIILLTGTESNYIVYEDDVDRAILDYMKESEEFKQTFKELIINGERII